MLRQDFGGSVERHRRDVSAVPELAEGQSNAQQQLSVLGTRTAADGGEVSPLAKRAGNARRLGRKSKLTHSPTKSEAYAVLNESA